MQNSNGHHPENTKQSSFRFSLALKIVTPVVCVIAAACLFLFTMYSRRAQELGNEYLRQGLENFATSKVEELAEPLWNFQTDFLMRLMRSYRDNDNLLYIGLYDTRGNLVAEETDISDVPYSNVLTTERSLNRTAGTESFDLGRLVVKYHNGKQLIVQKNRRESDIAFTAVLMTILAGAIWLSVHLLVGRPLRRIRKSLDENTASNKRTPLSWDSRDELGEVVRAYNTLLREVEQQTSALVSMNATLRYEVENRIIAEKELAKIHDELEHKVAMRTMELNIANQELIELDNQRAAFLSSASHELRTPLAAVLGFATLIKKNFNRHFMPLTEQYGLESQARTMNKNLAIIATEGGRLTRLIDDLLDLNKIEAGRMEWRDEELDVGKEMRRAVQTMRSMVDGKPDLEMSAEPDSLLPPLTCDPDRFQQLLTNLLSNAVKHTEKGTIRLSAKAGHNTIRIKVSDTGKGIPEEDRKLIFQRFYQIGGGKTYKPSGTGLGLAICRQIVKHYGGSISLTSKMGEGTTFTVELPSDRNIPQLY
ncbi:HAMP domain-containing protein [Pseudodesulfovibrio cashew]|uniref:histidine kinase n=1 Tax=Pseudodesulfovibrio cashew TaxID=2678688 RepID=A0A6I6JFH2_9BACT|nr:ATP-binding protein [Pseudodesulfovibrio cashew]QGY41576.1 HAMP domain-containing protein [Pseudodesulfovibrio cashew]